MFFFKTLLLFLSVSNTPALEVRTTQKEFKLHMITHPNKGCPENSKCSKVAGKRRLKWEMRLKTLFQNETARVKQLNLFKKKYGVPVIFWLSSNYDKKNQNLIVWNSHCKNHRIDNKPLFHQGESFIKSFDELKNNKHIGLNKIFLLDKNKSVVEFTASISEKPLTISKNRLYFIKEDKGIYLGILLSKNGRFDFTPIKSLKYYPSEISCPKPLTEFFNSLKKSSPSPYSDHFCKKIWDEDKKKWRKVLIEWACQ